MAGAVAGDGVSYWLGHHFKEQLVEVWPFSRYPESWAKAVATLLTDRQRLSVLSENSLVLAEGYSEEKIAEKVLRLYRRVVVLGKSNNT